MLISRVPSVLTVSVPFLLRTWREMPWWKRTYSDTNRLGDRREAQPIDHRHHGEKVWCAHACLAFMAQDPSQWASHSLLQYLLINAKTEQSPRRERRGGWQGLVVPQTVDVQGGGPIIR